MANRVKWNKNAAEQIMKSAQMQSVIGDEVEKITDRLPAGATTYPDYESTVESGGDRTRGAVWTRSPGAKRRNAEAPELLNALNGS